MAGIARLAGLTCGPGFARAGIATQAARGPGAASEALRNAANDGILR